jgi:RNA polymerase sigma-70 factor (ECF subfamily)
MSQDTVFTSDTAIPSATHMDDTQTLISQAAKGVEEAQTQIYKQYFDRIYRFIYYRVSHKQIAEDLTEEVFIKIFQSIASLKATLSFEGWCFRIARNAVIDHYRKNKIAVNIDELENTLEYHQNVVDDANSTLDQTHLLRLLKQLPPEQQIILKLKFFDELENEEIAEMLNKTEVSIRVTQHRAITKLKTLFEELNNG